MAGSAVVGALRVTLGLDSAQFSAGMKNAQTGLQRFAGVAKAGALAIGAAMVAAGGAVGVAMKGMIDQADEMSKLSQSLGITIGDLSRLKYAAALADVDIDGLSKAIKRLSAGMMEASQSTTGAAAQAFAMLGISVKDAEGNMRPAISVIDDLAERFSKLPDGAEKTALAMRIFGKSGADLIPLLNEGSAGLAELYAEAEQLGIVLDEETGRAAEAFNDNLTRMGVIKDGLITKITAGMLPSLVNLSNALVVAAGKSASLNSIGAALGWTIRALATSAVTAGGFFVALARDIATAAMVAGKWATGDFAGAAASLAVGNAARERTLSGVLAINRAIWSNAGAGGGGGGSRPPATVALDSVDTSARRARGSVERLTDAQREAQRAAEEMAREGRRTFEETRTPLEQYTARVEELRRQLAAAAIDQDTFNRAMREAQNRRDDQDPLVQAYNKLREDQAEAAAEAREDAIKLARDHEEDLRDATFNGISDGLHAAADGNLGQYLAAKLRERLIDGLANVLTNMVVGQPGQSGGGAMGWLKAAGSALKMFSGGLPGFKTGGSFKVGGAGGLDSQTVAFRATPGEMVDIRKPGQDQGGGAMSVHVVPSPYFDVQVQRVAGPVAQQAAGQMGRQVLDASRRAAPGLQSRQRMLGTT